MVPADVCSLSADFDASCVHVTSRLCASLVKTLKPFVTLYSNHVHNCQCCHMSATCCAAFLYHHAQRHISCINMLMVVGVRYVNGWCDLDNRPGEAMLKIKDWPAEAAFADKLGRHYHVCDYCLQRLASSCQQLPVLHPACLLELTAVLVQGCCCFDLLAGLPCYCYCSPCADMLYYAAAEGCMSGCELAYRPRHTITSMVLVTFQDLHSLYCCRTSWTCCP